LDWIFLQGIIRLMATKSGDHSPVEGKVVYPIIYDGFYTSKRWLEMGFSEASTVFLGHPISGIIQKKLNAFIERDFLGKREISGQIIIFHQPRLT